MTSVLLRHASEVEAAATLRPNAPWETANGWAALLPTIFITVGGWIQVGSGPVAFRFTAMAEDSFARRITRIGCSLLMLLLISKRFREVVGVCRKTRLFLVLPAIAFVSVLWSQNPSHTLVDAANLTLTTLFAVYLFVRYPGERLVSFLSFAAAISLLMCAFAVVFVPSVGIDAYQQEAWRGVFGQRNNCAVICVCFIVVALHHRACVLDEHIVRWTVFILASVFIVMSGSRTGWALTALAGALTFSMRLVQRMCSLDRVVFLMAIAVPIVALAFAVATNFNQTLAMMDKDPTMTQRTVIWAEVLPSIAKHPLQGYGYSAFWSGLNGESTHAVLATGWMEGQAQDGYLDLLLQLGLVGAVPLVWMFARGFKQAWSAIQKRVALPQVQLATVLLPLVLIENIGESSFLLPLGIPWFYALLAFLALAQPTKHAEAL
jgi:exopolysaccharide production protein ExoQ